MGRWGKVLVVIAVIFSAGAAFAMGDIYVSGTWRYKVTVAIDTPEGVKTGSTVHEVSNADSGLEILDLPESGNPAEFRGEAVTVDLGKRGLVFAILPANPEYMFYAAFPVPDGGATTVRGIKYFNSLKAGERRELKPEDYPDMVMFKDLNDPKTVTSVYRDETYIVNGQAALGHNVTDDMEEIFGKGVKLKSVALEITQEPVTWEIDKTLVWIKSLKGGYLHGGPTSRGSPLGLHAGNFKAGDE